MPGFYVCKLSEDCRCVPLQCMHACMHNARRRENLVFPASRLISDVKGHLETIMCIFQSSLPTHSLLNRAPSHTVLLDLPALSLQQYIQLCLPSPLPLTHHRNFLFLSFSADPFQYHRSSSSLSETMSALRSSGPSLLLDQRLDPEPVKKETLLKTHTHTYWPKCGFT